MTELLIELIQKCISEGDKCSELHYTSKLNCFSKVSLFLKFYETNKNDFIYQET